MKASVKFMLLCSLVVFVLVAILASTIAAPAAAEKEDATPEKPSFLEQVARRSQTLWSQFKWPMTQTYLQRHAKLLGIFLTAGVTGMYLLYQGQKLISCLRKRSTATSSTAVAAAKPKSE